MKSKILIIEDDAVMSKLLSGHLSKDEYEVDIALDGEEGLQKVKSFQPDLILLDLILPKIDGLTILKALKQNPAVAHIPVCIITNLQTEENVAEAMEAGSTEYLVKINYTVEEISAKIKEILEK